MSYAWKPVEGQEWSNRARYNIHVMMRKANIPASKVKIEGVSAKKIYEFLVGKQDITVKKLGAIADFLGVSINTLFKAIPDVPEVVKPPYRHNQPPLPLEDVE